MAETFPAGFESWTKPRKFQFVDDFGLELRSGVTLRSTVAEVDRAIRAAWDRQYPARADQFAASEILRAPGVLDVPPQAVAGAIAAGLLQDEATIEEAAAAVEAYLGQEVRS